MQIWFVVECTFLLTFDLSICKFKIWPRQGHVVTQLGRIAY